MSRTARPWRGAGLLLLGGALLSGARAFGADEPPMSNQLSDLGRQALAQGANRTAETFFKKSLELDPANAAAIGRAQGDQAMPTKFCAWRCKSPRRRSPPAAGGRDAASASAGRRQGDPRAGPGGREYHPAGTDRQRRAADPKTAQALMNQNQPEAAMNALRLALNVIRSATDVPEDVRTKLERRVQAQLMSVAQAEERIVAERAERTRLDAAAEQRTRTIDLLQRRQADDRSDDDPVRPADERRRLQRPLQRRHGQHRHDLGPVRRSQAAGAASLRPSARRAAPLQRQRPRAHGRLLRLLLDGLLQPGNPVPDAHQVSLPAHDAGRHPRVGSVPRHPDDRVPRRRLVARHLRKTNPEVREGRRPLRPRRKDEANHREARRADLDVVQRGNPARRRPQVHQAGDDHRHLPGHSDLRRPDRPLRKPTRR